MRAIQVPISKIDINALPLVDPRFDTGDIQDLAASIQSVGLLEPVGVRPLENGKYSVIYGARRVAAMSVLGWTSIPAILVQGDQSDDALKSLVENIQRRQLSRAERADALERLVATGVPGKDIAARLGVNPTITWQWLKVGRSKALLAALRNDRIGIHEARAMCSLPDQVIAELLPELADKPEPWKQARIARAVDDHRLRPPNGTFKRHAETHVRRSLELILEHARGIKEIRTQREIDLLRDIIGVVAQWQRDLLRAQAQAESATGARQPP